jgi:SAM-dependent methyltransferase
MPDEAYWETLFDVPLVLERLGIDRFKGDVVELGCGYGTFTIPIARGTAGTVHTFDIDPAMVARTEQRAVGLPICCQLRDVLDQGFGVRGDAVLLFNILHCEEPAKLLRQAADALNPGGRVLVIHWQHRQTPRGPSLDIRPRPEQIVDWAAQAGLRSDGKTIDLPPWHYGLRFSTA